MFVANPDEEIGSPTSPPTSASSPRTPTRASSWSAPAPTATSSRPARASSTRGTVHGRAAHAGRRAREGPQRDPRGGADRPRPARAQRPLAGRDRQRRGDRRRDAPERRRGALRARGRRPRHDRRRPRGGRGRDRAISPRRPWSTSRRSSRSDGAWRPMEKLARSGRLVEHAQALAGRLGFEVNDTATGGASDANTTAGMGVPTLDGLGPIGGNDHSPAEYLEVDSIVPRTTLLAGLLLAIGRDPEVLGWRADDPRRRRVSGRATADLVGRAVGGGRRYSRAVVVGDSCWVAGHDRRRARRHVAHPGDVALRPGPSSGSSSGPSPRPGSRSTDVVRTRMFVTDMADAARVGGPRRGLRRDPAGGHDGRGGRRSCTRACSSRSRPRRAAAEAARSVSRERRPGRRARDGHDRDRHDQPEEQVASPRDDGQAGQHRDPLDADVEDGAPRRRHGPSR